MTPGVCAFWRFAQPFLQHYIFNVFGSCPLKFEFFSKNLGCCRQGYSISSQSESFDTFFLVTAVPEEIGSFRRLYSLRYCLFRDSSLLFFSTLEIKAFRVGNEDNPTVNIHPSQSQKVIHDTFLKILSSNTIPWVSGSVSFESVLLSTANVSILTVFS